MTHICGNVTGFPCNMVHSSRETHTIGTRRATRHTVAMLKEPLGTRRNTTMTQLQSIKIQLRQNTIKLFHRAHQPQESISNFSVNSFRNFSNFTAFFA